MEKKNEIAGYGAAGEWCYRLPGRLLWKCLLRSRMSAQMASGGVG